ncbi:MAG: hypothetical protein HY791_20965 [Deltaproteobacteria bacterium]|nr:hypothetical protein [Deltaproteobacteria bacterium]
MWGLSRLSPTLATLASFGLLALATVAYADGTPSRVAWLGVARGPLAPVDGTAVEHQVLEALALYPSALVVDAGGRPLGQKALEDDANTVRRLVTKGIDHLLELEYVPADEAIDQAIARFEARLVASEDYSLLEDALRTKAESHLQQGRREQARTTLMRLAALEPKAPPTEKTHLPSFVKLYQEARQKLGERAMIEVRAEGAEIRVDGAALGPAPVSAGPLLPGRHYVVARWPNGLETRVVQLSAGRPTVVDITREGPAEQLRRDVLETAELRRGQPEAKSLTARAVELAEAQNALVVAAKKSDTTALIFALHDRQGRLVSIVRSPLPDTALDRARVIGSALATIFLDRRRGDLAVDAEGKVQPIENTAEVLYGKPARDASLLADAGEAEVLAADLRGPPPPPAEPETDALWLWVAGGALVVGAAVATAAVLASPEPVATDFRVRVAQ